MTPQRSAHTDSEPWDETRERVLERDGRACRFCHMTDDEHREEYDSGLHIHHTLPERAGGSDRPANLITVCYGCHRALEEAQARALGEMYHEAVGEIEETVEKYLGHVDTLDEVLADYARRHPTFAQRFGIPTNSDNMGGAPVVWASTMSDEFEPPISEFEWAAAWGFREGVMQVAAEVDGKVDFEAYRDADGPEGGDGA